MFYRRKIMLALIEAFGGSLTKLDCQKLLLLFCLRRGKNYYDFFAHTSGNFSVLLAQDKERLTNLDLLTSLNDFQLPDSSSSTSYLHNLKLLDQIVLRDLVSEIGSLRGEALLHKAYLEAPHYVSRSQIATHILSEKEYVEVSQTWNTDHQPCLFTIGYEGLSIDAYLDLLISNNIRVLVDVRKNPLSMKYGFSKKKLAAYTRLADIDYVHIPALGIASSLRQDLNDPLSYQILFDHYATQILPQQQSAITQLKQIIAQSGRVAITCFEADHHFCHRHKVAEYLENDPQFNTPIVHLHE